MVAEKVCEGEVVVVPVMVHGSCAGGVVWRVDMITSMRAYESGQKVIQTLDTELGKAASDVGRVNG